MEGNAEWTLVCAVGAWVWSKRSALKGLFKKTWRTESRLHSASMTSLGLLPILKKIKPVPRGPVWDGFVRMPEGSTYSDIFAWKPELAFQKN